MRAFSAASAYSRALSMASAACVANASSDERVACDYASYRISHRSFDSKTRTFRGRPLNERPVTGIRWIDESGAHDHSRSARQIPRFQGGDLKRIVRCRRDLERSAPAKRIRRVAANMYKARSPLPQTSDAVSCLVELFRGEGRDNYKLDAVGPVAKTAAGSHRCNECGGKISAHTCESGGPDRVNRVSSDNAGG